MYLLSFHNFNMLKNDMLIGSYFSVNIIFLPNLQNFTLPSEIILYSFIHKENTL